MVVAATVCHSKRAHHPLSSWLWGKKLPLRERRYKGRGRDEIGRRGIRHRGPKKKYFLAFKPQGNFSSLHTYNKKNRKKRERNMRKLGYSRFFLFFFFFSTSNLIFLYTRRAIPRVHCVFFITFFISLPCFSFRPTSSAATLSPRGEKEAKKTASAQL